VTRRRAALTAAAAVALVLVVALAARGPSPPADRADSLVPADVLVYLHVSTDPDREQDRRMLALLQRFPAFGALRARAQAAVGALDFARDVRPWLGDEAALAASTRGTVALLAVRDEDKAQGVLARVAGPRPAVRRSGVLVRRFSGGAAAFTDGFLVLGDEALVNAAIDLGSGRGRALATLPAYADAALERPAARVLDGWAAADAAALLLPPRVAAVVGGGPAVADVTPTDAGLRIRARRLGGASQEADFEPELLDRVPRDAFAYLGVRGLRSLGVLLPAAAGEAAPAVGGALEPLLDALEGEVAVSAAPAAGDPAVTLVAGTRDPRAARNALAGMQGVIAAALTGSGEATGQVPVFEERSLGEDVDGFALTLAGGGELVYAVAGDQVAISNSEDGVRRALEPEGGGLEDAEGFDDAVTDVPESGQALAFVATSQLLELAAEAGLDASAAYRAVRSNLAKVRALGAVVRRQGDDTTAELNLLIP